MITFRKLEQTIVGTVDGKPFNVIRNSDTEKALTKMQNDNASYEKVMQFVKDSRNLEITSKNKFLTYNPLTHEYFLTFEGFRSSQAIPSALVTYIENSYNKNIDFMPIIKTWALLLTNPRYTPAMGEFFNEYLNRTFVDNVEVEKLLKEGYSKEVAQTLATYQDIAITQEGLLATYKVAEIVTWEYLMVLNEKGEYEKVRNLKYKAIPPVLDSVTGEVLTEGSFEKPEFLEDYVFTPAIYKSGDKFFSGNVLGYTYKVGEMQWLPAKALRNLQNTFGGGGLYIGGLSYIEAYKKEGTHVLTCFVNPGDILSFQSEGGAIRVDALFPNNVWEETIPLKGLYHSSEYNKMSNERLEAIIKDAVNREVDLKIEQDSFNQ